MVIFQLAMLNDSLLVGTSSDILRFSTCPTNPWASKYLDDGNNHQEVWLWRFHQTNQYLWNKNHQEQLMSSWIFVPPESF